jgi:hypothetical protein
MVPAADVSAVEVTAMRPPIRTLLVNVVQRVLAAPLQFD